MNSSLRRRLVHQHGEMYVKKLELALAPPKIEREVKREPTLNDVRVSKNVIRRRRSNA